MAKEPFEQFAMPNEVRAFVEQSVAQARVAFDGIANAANQAVAQWQGQAQAARAGASEIAHKSMAYAEQNMAATFDFAQKLMHASSHVAKTYLVKISGKASEKEIDKLRAGIMLPAERRSLKTPADRVPKAGWKRRATARP